MASDSSSQPNSIHDFVVKVRFNSLIFTFFDYLSLDLLLFGCYSYFTYQVIKWLVMGLFFLLITNEKLAERFRYRAPKFRGLSLFTLFNLKFFKKKLKWQMGFWYELVQHRCFQMTRNVYIVQNTSRVRKMLKGTN